MSAADRTAVGVVGVGALGGDVARALVAGGHDVVAYDTRLDAIASVDGAREADSLAALAAESHTVCIVVRSDCQVVEVVAELVDHAAPGSALLVHSTVSVETITAAGEAARRAGLALLDVGLCRPGRLDEGLLAMVGGERNDVAKAMPVLSSIAGTVHHLGALGAGMTMKAIRNAVLYSQYASVGDALDTARAAGLSVDTAIDALLDAGVLSSVGSAFVEHREGWVADPHAHEPAAVAERAGYVDLAMKDLGVALEIAGAAGLCGTFALPGRRAIERAFVVDDDQRAV